MALRTALADLILPRVTDSGSRAVAKLFKSELPLGHISDVLAFALPLSVEAKQELLEITDVLARAADGVVPCSGDRGREADLLHSGNVSTRLQRELAGAILLAHFALYRIEVAQVSNLSIEAADCNGSSDRRSTQAQVENLSYKGKPISVQVLTLHNASIEGQPCRSVQQQ